MACTAPATSDGTCGAATFARAVRPDASRYWRNDVCKALPTLVTDPETGKSEPCAVPTVSPSDRNRLLTLATVDGVGPNWLAYSAGVRNCRYCGEPGVETAVVNAFSAA